MRKVTLVLCATWIMLFGVSCGSEDTVPAGKTAPHATIEIVRDDLGIAHVYGDSDADVMYGSGYSMAEDRLFEMEVFRRRSRGERASLFGKSYLADDIAARTFGFRTLGEADAARTKYERPGDYALVATWAAGVNARIAEIRSGAVARPYGFGTGTGEINLVPDDWTAEDAFAIGKLLSYGLSDTLTNEILATAIKRLAPDFFQAYPLLMPGWDAPQVGPATAAQALRALPPQIEWPTVPPATGNAPPGPLRFFEEHFASNNWAVGGQHTDNGRPLLCGDPHQTLTSPARFYPIHLDSTRGGGSLDVIGFSFVGTPVVELGHNAHVGWTATTSFADVMDLWGVNPNDDNTAVTLWDGEHRIEATTETIQIKDGDKLSEQSFQVLRVPGYGVLLPAKLLPVPVGLLTSSRAILANWTGLRPTNELAAYLAMDRSTDIPSWEKAVDLIEVGAQNFVGADAKSISYRVHALIPDRGDPSAHQMPWLVLDGAAAGPDSGWSRGFLPDDKLPHLVDPARGYIGTANADPFGFTADGDVSNDPYYFGAFFANGSRARRINDELSRLVSSGTRISVQDMMALQRDHHSLLADTVIPLLEHALAAATTDPTLSAYADRADLHTLGDALLAWDRSMAPDRGEPLAFIGLTWFAARHIFSDRMSKLLFDAVAEKSPPYLMGALRNTLSDRYATASSLIPEGKDALLLAALDETAAWLSGRFGSIDVADYKLTDVQAAVFAPLFPGGSFDVPAVPVGGGTDTINVAASAFFQGDTPRTQISPQDMSLYRMIMSFADDGVPEAHVNFAMGVSGEPTSPHFLDQQQRWAAVEYTPLPFRKGVVEQRAASRRSLPPPAIE